MNKQGIYITIINSIFGVAASLLLKDNLVIACIIGTLVIITIIMVERAWLNEKIFRNRRIYAVAAYSMVLFFFVIVMLLVTEPIRKTSAVIASTTTFLTGVKSGDYKTAYSHLSNASQLRYSLDDFVKDHSHNKIKIGDFTIEQVTFNKFDSKKALAIVTSPFTLYGHETLQLELIKEDKAWHIIFSRNTVVMPSLPISSRTKKSGGAISNFFNTLF